ncbi:MAG: LamG domain-containing protein [Patescibacteria group bacterium]|nr:LamG domain-containing protein [Patescibacteria group bacterium]
MMHRLVLIAVLLGGITGDAGVHVGNQSRAVHVAPAVAPVNPAAFLNANLVSYMTMTSVTDSILGSHWTALNTTFSAANGKIGNGAGFTGVFQGSYINGTVVAINGPFSVSLWVKPAALTTCAGLMGGQNLLFSLVATSGQVALGSFAVPTVYATHISTGVWTHLLITSKADGATPVKLYVNGVLDAATGPLLSQFTWVMYGGDNNTCYMNGALDEVGVWNVEQPASAATTLYNGGAGRQYPF